MTNYRTDEMTKVACNENSRIQLYESVDTAVLYLTITIHKI